MAHLPIVALIYLSPSPPLASGTGSSLSLRCGPPKKKDPITFSVRARRRLGRSNARAPAHGGYKCQVAFIKLPAYLLLAGQNAVKTTRKKKHHRHHHHPFVVRLSWWSKNSNNATKKDTHRANKVEESREGVTEPNSWNCVDVRSASN